MRIIGSMKITGILLMDFLVMYYILGIKISLLIVTGIMLYGLLGEYFALLKDGAIPMKYMNDYEKQKIIRVHSCLIDDVKRVSGKNISKLKIHIISSDNMNAFAYGINNVAVTRGTLNNCDDTILCAVLGHEVSHILGMDAVVNRLVVANVTLAMIMLSIESFIAASFMWILFALLCAIGVCRGFFSIFFFHGSKNLVKAIFMTAQRIILFLYQIVMGAVSRRFEFRADRYSCKLGYALQLKYFLSRFVVNEENKPKTLTEIIYDSHPPIYKRIRRIEKYQSVKKEMKVANMEKS